MNGYSSYYYGQHAQYYGFMDQMVAQIAYNGAIYHQQVQNNPPTSVHYDPLQQSSNSSQNTQNLNPLRYTYGVAVPAPTPPPIVEENRCDSSKVPRRRQNSSWDSHEEISWIPTRVLKTSSQIQPRRRNLSTREKHCHKVSSYKNGIETKKKRSRPSTSISLAGPSTIKRNIKEPTVSNKNNVGPMEIESDLIVIEDLCAESDEEFSDFTDNVAKKTIVVYTNLDGLTVVPAKLRVVKGIPKPGDDTSNTVVVFFGSWWFIEAVVQKNLPHEACFVHDTRYNKEREDKMRKRDPTVYRIDSMNNWDIKILRKLDRDDISTA